MDLDGVVAGRSAILYASEGSDTYWREPFVRQGFGAAGILIAAAILAGVASFARRRGRLLFGAFTLLVAVPAAMATVLSDEYRFIPGAIVAGLLRISRRKSGQQGGAGSPTASWRSWFPRCSSPRIS